ncbi:hypothetical protein JTE90_011995 [Oedothorax gibbosus]|uniref:Uncharacterized protein n=1 Tax=Oedothorax gibbosus TaxID=931172 RepID=A0AAV6UPI0_9ARAC|nr:hypothetical protein JTE90_011995 [Oedothorax gibbosus]
MNQRIVKRVLVLNEFRFTVVCGLFIGLLCLQTGCVSSRSPCDPRTHFPCRSTPSLCVLLSQVRDGRVDCPDASDEECPNGMHRCTCGIPKCIDQNKVADGVNDCQDGSDEGEDGSNYLCAESLSDDDPFSIEMKKRRRRHSGHRNDPVVYPSGIISAFVGTEVNGDETTYHTTQLYRTYIDGTYTELLQSTSMVSPTPTLESTARMESTANANTFGSLNSGKVFLTAVNEPMSSSEPTMELSETFDMPTTSNGNYHTESTQKQPFYRSSNSSKKQYLDIPTTQPTVVTRYIQSTAYPETRQPVLAMVNGNTIGVVGNIVKPPEEYSLRGHQGHNRQGRMYNGNQSARRVGQGGATIITDQFIFPGHRMESSKTKDATDAYNRDITNAYYDIEGLNFHDQLKRLVKPTIVKDNRLTRTVGLYGPIYDVVDDKNVVTSSKTPSEEILSSTTLEQNGNNDVTTTLYGFAEFSTRISGTQYIFLPSSTRPRTFVPRVTRTSFINGAAASSKSTNNENKPNSQPEAFFRKPLFGTDTREFISQKSMFTSTVIEPVEIKTTMFTSTVMTKQPTPEESTRARKVDKIEETVVAETLPLNLATVYMDKNEKSKTVNGGNIFLNFGPLKKHSMATNEPRKLDVSEIIDNVEVSTKDVQPSQVHPTGLVSSITGTEIQDGTTTHWTTLILGTYIDNTYAHVIESTSSIFFTVSKTAIPEETMSSETESFPETSNVERALPTNLETSSDNTVNLVSSIADLSTSAVTSSISSREAVFSTPSLEILTSGFILPDNKDDSIKYSTFESSKVNAGNSPSVSTPTVVYADENAGEKSEASEKEMLHILTEGFILPKEVEPELTLSSTSDVSDVGKENENEAKQSSDRESLLRNLNLHITGSEISETDAKVETDSETMSASTNEMSDLSTSTKDDNPKVSSYVVLLTGDFILPSIVAEADNQKASSNSEDSLREDITSSTPQSLSILTDGFILPGEIQPSETLMDSSNVLPSSALLTADHYSAVNENDIGTDGRSAGEAIKDIILDSDISPSEVSSNVLIEENKLENVRSGKALNIDSPENPKVEEIASSLYFPVTYYTTSTYYTTFLSDDSTVVSSRKETVSNVYTDSEHLKSAKLNPTGALTMTQVIQPSTTVDPNEHLTTYTYFTTSYKDGSKIVSSRKETKSDIFAETSTLPTETHPTTYYTTLTYFTTLFENGKAKIVSNEAVLSNVVTPTDYKDPNVHIKETMHPEGHSAASTHFTTFTYFTTFHKDGTTSVSTTYKTVTNVLGENDSIDSSPTSTTYKTDSLDNESELRTYLTTYTYYTTYLKDGKPIVSSREEIVSNVRNAETKPIEYSYTDNELSTKPLKTTFYTTYTFYTTLLKEGTTTVSTRKETVSNVRDSEDTSFEEPSILMTSIPQISVTPTVKTHFTTYTYFTTFLRDGSSVVSSREDTVTNIITEKPTISFTPTRSFSTYYTTLTSYYTLFNGGKKSVSTVFDTLTDIVALENEFKNTILSTPSFTTDFSTNNYLTTKMNSDVPVISKREDAISKIVTLDDNVKPVTLVHDVTPLSRSTSEEVQPTAVRTQTYYTTYTFFTTYLSRGQPSISTRLETLTNYVTETVSLTKPNSVTHTIPTPAAPIQSYSTYLEGSINSSPELHESLSTTDLRPTTHYTTYTYFTTLLSEGSSVVQSRTHVVSTVLNPHTTKEKTDIVPSSSTILMNTEEPRLTVPSVNTAYTTFTYYTTLFSNGSPITQTMYSTLTNEITIKMSPTIVEKPIKTTTDLEAAEGELYEKRVQPTPVVTYYTTHTYVATTVDAEGQTKFITREVVSSATVKPDNGEISKPVHESSVTKCSICPTQYPYTFYTTYTYYTTRYHGNQPIINTRYQTITNVIKAPIETTSSENLPTTILPSTDLPHRITQTMSSSVLQSTTVSLYEPASPRNNNHEASVSHEIKNTAEISTVETFSVPEVKDTSTEFPTTTTQKDTTKLNIIPLHENSENSESSVTDTVTTETNKITTLDNPTSTITNENPILVTTNDVTTEMTSIETTTVSDSPKRGVFLRRNRPVYKPRPSFRSSSPSTTTTTEKPSGRTTTTRSALNFNRRNTTRLLYRRPSLAPRTNPLQRRRPLRPTLTPTTLVPDDENVKRRRRSNIEPEGDFYFKPIGRKLFATTSDENLVIARNNDLSSSEEKSNEALNHQLGLIQSMESQSVNDGVTTIYGTEIHGSIINGEYAQVTSTKVKILSDTSNEIAKTPVLEIPSLTSTDNIKSTTETNKVGLVSSKINTAVRNGLTTVYTTNTYGTYIGDVYAHLAQTTSSVIQPTSVTQTPYPTGLISSIVRLEENYGTTTQWTTQIFGTFVNNYYAHIASTQSNIFVGDQSSQPLPSPTAFQNQLYSENLNSPKLATPTARSVDLEKPYKTGLLSSILSEEEHDGTTTHHITNIYGTYIGEHYAKHAKTTSSVITPTKATTSTRSVGLLSTIVNTVVSKNTATLYKTEIYGTYFGQHYAQIARTSTDYKVLPTESPQFPSTSHKQKTGLLSTSVVRSEINSGTTTMHINEIYGTYIGNAYAHIAKSTSKVVQPASIESKERGVFPTVSLQKTGLISASVKTEVNDGTTTLHTNEIHGTYVGNYYAHVARRTSRVLAIMPSETSEPQLPTSTNINSEGLISSDIRTEINQGTTTLHTREVYGTFINGYYAHVARSTSNVITPTQMSTTPSTGLVSVITSSETNYGLVTLHTTEIYGTQINGFYAHIARSTSNVLTSTSEPVKPSKIVGIISATTSTEIKNGQTTLHMSSLIGTEINGVYMQSVKLASTVFGTPLFHSEPMINTFKDTNSRTIIPAITAKDDLDTARVNELENENQYISLTKDTDLDLKTPVNLDSHLTSPSLILLNTFSTIKEDFSITSTFPIMDNKNSFTEEHTDFAITENSILRNNDASSSTLASLKETTTKETTTENKPENPPRLVSYDDNRTFEDRESVTVKPTTRETGIPRKSKTPIISSSRNSDLDEYDEYGLDEDYGDLPSTKQSRKVTPSLTSTRFKNTRQPKRKSQAINDKDYDDYDDYDYNENETDSFRGSKKSESSTSTETPSSSIKIRPFTGRGRTSFTTTSRSSTKPSFTIQFRRPSRTRNSRAYGSRSDGENDFDDEIDEEDEEGDIEASEAVVTTATPQALNLNRRKPFGSSRYQPPGRNTPSTTTSRPVSLGRNRRPFGRSSTASPSPTPSVKDSDEDYEENTTEDDDFDDYEDINEKKEANRNRNFRSTRRPPSRQSRFGERRSASNKRGSIRHREEEEIENDDFDATTPNYRNTRNRGNQRKASRSRYNRNNSQSLKASFNSVNRDDEDDEDSQSFQPINRIRNNNRNRRPSYNPRTRRPSKTASETQTIRKPYLTVTSVITTVKTLPIYHGFRTSYATLTTTVLDTSIINPTQYSEVVGDDGMTKTLFYSKTGYPDGLENHHTTITEVVVTTTSLASVKLVPIKIGFSTRTDTITDIQVLTTLSTVYSTITPDVPLPTAFPQQFQPNFYPQLGPQNQDFGLVASANSFITTHLVTSTTVVPIILRGRTILSTLTTTSIAESTVVQNVPQYLPQSAPNFIPQPYFAFQPLTTLLTLYVTGEHGELKPVVTTVTVPLYQQPVYHTKVARSLQQNTPVEHSLKTADIMDFQLLPSVNQGNGKEIDIDTHYDQLLSSGLEEINDLSEMKNINMQTEPLDGIKIASTPDGGNFNDITTISKGPLTEIYEQKVTVNNVEHSSDAYGLESRYSFRKLQQFIEEDESVFRPQRDFTRLRRPPAGVILATGTNPNLLNQPTREFSPRPRQIQPNRRPITTVNEDLPPAGNVRNGFRGSFSRPPQRQPESDIRPLNGRFVPPPSTLDNELVISRQPPLREAPIQPSPIAENYDRNQDLPNSLRNANRNSFNGFQGSPTDAVNNNGFRPLNNPRGLRRGPAINDLNSQPGVNNRPNILRLTRPVNPEVNTGGVRRVTRVRTPEIETTSSLFETERPTTTNFDSTTPNNPNILEVSTETTEFTNVNENLPTDENSSVKEEENGASRRTVFRRIRPSFVPGDGSGPRRTGLVRRTRINENPVSSVIPVEESTAVTPTTEEYTIIEEEEVTSTTSEPEEENGSVKPPVKKIVRLRKPENSENLQPGTRRRVVISRRPTVSEVPVSGSLQGRGPVLNSEIVLTENNNHFSSSENDLDSFNGVLNVPNDKNSKVPVDPELIQTKTYPITYFTTLTYFTTFVHGGDTNYVSREATFSNVLDQTLNPALITAIKSNKGKITATNANSILHLASRTLGDTTTIVNLASKQNLYNSALFSALQNEEFESKITKTVDIAPIVATAIDDTNAIKKTPINDIASLPKTYLTLFTYSYTFFDGINRRQSTRAETMTNVASDLNDFLTESIGSYINGDGLLNVGPETRTVHLGSREVKGTTTEVNLGLKTLIRVDGVRNVIIEKTEQPFQYVTPSRSSNTETHTVREPPTSAIHLESSYSLVNEVLNSNEQPTTTETSPLFTVSGSDISDGPKSFVKVTSVIHKSSGPLRSGVFEPRPGVRVRVKPVVSRRLVPSELASSFDLSFDLNELSTEIPTGQEGSATYTPPGINMGVTATPVLEGTYPFFTNMAHSSEGLGNEIVTEEFETDLEESTLADGVVPTRKKLKVTVRRQSESVSRTHTRFVLPSRFEITSKPRFYVVTRTGALGVVSNTQRPFTVKVSRKLKPTTTEVVGQASTTVIYDTYTTLTSVPVIFGLETSYRNVILTTSSPITVSFVPTPTYEAESAVMPSTVVLTYFTTTTFTIPFVVGDQTMLTTLEETNSRIVTQTLGEYESLSYSTITRTWDPTPITSVEFGFDGPITHTLSPGITELPRETPALEPSTTLYDTKTFFTTYTFFSTFFAGTDAVVSSSEQVITNVVTVPVTTDVLKPSAVDPDPFGPLTVFDTSENVITRTNYNTITFYATLFSDTSSFVTPIEEVETQLQTITETFTITRTSVPTPSASLPPISEIPVRAVDKEDKSVVLTRTLYTTLTNFVTLFQGTNTIITNLEETVSNIVTLTVPEHAASSFSIVPTSPSYNEISPTVPVYTTREVLSTQTHYLTLFNNDQSILSSIEEVVTKYVTEEVKSISPSVSTDSYFTSSPEVSFSLQSPSVRFETESDRSTSTSEVQTYHPELVPSIRTIFSTITFYTTYFSDTSSIVATQEEVLTSFVTLFVPPSLISSTSSASTPKDVIQPTSTTDPSVFVFTTTDYSTLTLYTTLFSGDEIVVISSEHVVPEVITATITPSSITPSETSTINESVLTFLTTFTYYTTYFSGTDPVIASSESVVTQFVTIEATESISSSTETVIESTPVVETVIGTSTSIGEDISSSFKEDFKDLEIIGVSSIVATGTAIEASSKIETNVEIASNVHSEIGFNTVLSDTKTQDDVKEITSNQFDVVSSFTLPAQEDSSSATPTLMTSSIDSINIPKDISSPVTSTSIVEKETEIIGVDGKITSLSPSDTLILVTGTDGFVTKLAEVDMAVLSPVYISSVEESVASASSDIKPATVIELSDLIGGNTALGGDIGLTIQDIVSRITGKKNKTETDVTTELTTTEVSTEETVTGATNMTEETTGTSLFDSTYLTSTEKDTKKEDEMESKEIDYPVFVFPSTTPSTEGDDEPKALEPIYVAPKENETFLSTEVKDKSSTVSSKQSHSISTSVITGARTVFILPTKQSTTHDQNKDRYSIVGDTHKNDGIPKLESSKETIIDSSMTLPGKSSTDKTPSLKATVGTSIISGIRTIFFGSSTDKTADSEEKSTVFSFKERILGRANSAIERPKTFTTLTKDGQTVASRSTSGATTIFFPGQAPKNTSPATSTLYITSVESITRTLALTTTRTYYTRDTTLTVPSMYTTTIPPRTFVSTIIGSRTILGILPDETETTQIHKTLQPSERTTTVTTTTLIFNSIPSTVIRTLVLPTGVPTITVRSEASATVTTPEVEVFSAGTEKPSKGPEVGDSKSARIETSEDYDEDVVEIVPKSRDETYLRAAGPRLHDFRPNVRVEEAVHRPPIVVTERTRPESDPFLNGRNGVCDPKCQPYKKEVCKESDGIWTCQCRSGHARRDDHDICKEIQTFSVLLKVVKMGNESVIFNNPLSNTKSKEYKEFARNAREGIADAYSITNVKDHIYDAEVNNIMPGDAMMRPDFKTTLPSIVDNNGGQGVIVNFTVQVSKSVSSNLLEQELSRSLQSNGMMIGDSALLTAPLSQNVQDYDECLDLRSNDCALNAKCVNLEGTFTCECNEGFEDMDRSLPGRTCLAITENCNYCHGRGDCLQDEDKTFCRCQPMFVGRRCEINGLVLAVALPAAVAIVILLMCVVLCCCRKCKKKSRPNNGGDPSNMYRGIALKGPVEGTLDRKAMIDTSSESSGEHVRKGMPFDGYQESGDVTPYKSSKRSDISLNRSLASGFTSPPAMIPRAKQPHVAPNGKPKNYTVYDGQVYVW